MATESDPLEITKEEIDSIMVRTRDELGEKRKEMIKLLVKEGLTEDQIKPIGYLMAEIECGTYIMGYEDGIKKAINLVSKRTIPS